MFSGTKGTDLINTMLNLAYFKLAADFLADICGLTLADLYHVLQGDDVWISTTTPHRQAAVYYVINAMGLVTQLVKQMFGRNRGYTRMAMPAAI